MTTPNRFEEALLACRADVVAAAESKLDRALSPEERAGVDRMVSLMKLEALHRAFASPVSSPTDVENELRHLTSLRRRDQSERREARDAHSRTDSAA